MIFWKKIVFFIHLIFFLSIIIIQSQLVPYMFYVNVYDLPCLREARL